VLLAGSIATGGAPQCAPMPTHAIEPSEPAALSEPSPPTDEALMLAYASGDHRAFDVLYGRHERGVFRFIARAIGRRCGEGVADELMQETWLSVIRQATHYEPSAKFSTWLYTIARSRVIDQVRRTRAAGGTALSLDDVGVDGQTLGDTLTADENDAPLAQVETRAQAQAFFAAIDALPGEQRITFLLQADAGLSVEDIATATGVGAETAKSRLRYARRRLRELLKDWL
jgi:RNA polymerase sigma factor (sigma-70 family)